MQRLRRVALHLEPCAAVDSLAPRSGFPTVFLPKPAKTWRIYENFMVFEVFLVCFGRFCMVFCRRERYKEVVRAYVEDVQRLRTTGDAPNLTIYEMLMMIPPNSAARGSKWHAETSKTARKHHENAGFRMFSIISWGYLGAT